MPLVGGASCGASDWMKPRLSMRLVREKQREDTDVVCGHSFTNITYRMALPNNITDTVEQHLQIDYHNFILRPYSHSASGTTQKQKCVTFILLCSLSQAS